MSSKKMLAVDLGASGGKCFAGEIVDGKLVMQEVHRFAHDGVDFFREDSKGVMAERTVWDDVFIYRNIITGLNNFKREFGAQLDSIGIDTWGADGQLMTADGDMLGNVYCYRDHRLDNMIDKVKSCMDPDRIYEITGIHFQPFNLSNQLHWFVLNREELIRPGCFFLPVPSLFYYYLGGTKFVDSTWASVTQIMGAKQKAWSTEILAALGIPLEMMPEIVEPGKVIGQLTKPLANSLGLNQADLVAVGSHDTASAFAAAPVDNPDEALIISSGTWSLVGKLIPEPITSKEAMSAGISNEGGIGNVRFLKNCMGTWLAQELLRGWAVEDGQEPSWKELDEQTLAAPSFTAVLDVDDESFYNPSSMQDAIIDFCKKTEQSVPSDRGTFLRVVYESLALKYRMVNEQLSTVTGKETKVVNIVGGGTKNPLLNQFTADCLGIPVVAGPVEGTAIGNLMVQALGNGVIKSMSEVLPIVRASFPINDYHPGDQAPWNEAYDKLKSVVK